mmetsp:Transcript_29959/g.72645  ORF Transcript_29959/g.72645 Transcript_29959/m.72645 type:complete len:1007 (+) Transcript_29959:13-3033(+)
MLQVGTMIDVQQHSSRRATTRSRSRTRTRTRNNNVVGAVAVAVAALIALAAGLLLLAAEVHAFVGNTCTDLPLPLPSLPSSSSAIRRQHMSPLLEAPPASFRIGDGGNKRTRRRIRHQTTTTTTTTTELGLAIDPSSMFQVVVESVHQSAAASTAAAASSLPPSHLFTDPNHLSSSSLLSSSAAAVIDPPPSVSSGLSPLAENNNNPIAQFVLPFKDVAKQLSQSLDIGQSELGRQSQYQLDFSDEETRVVLGSVGSDLLVFLTASVVVTTVANAINITPILLYLIVGAFLGPNTPLASILPFFNDSSGGGIIGAPAIQNAQASVELGDFGILFLLFSEGLEVTTARLYKLTNYLPLALAQVSLTTGILTFSLLSVGRVVINNGGSGIIGGGDDPSSYVDSILNGNFDDLISNLLINIQDPIQACVLAVTCALSTSAFIFPVLKEKGWEEEPSGEAATTILLLQDLLVAPLLVVLPLVVNVGPTDYNAIGFLTAKATIGFGSVVLVGSFLLQKLFRLVSQTRSSETFVALSLLVSVGMGEIARILGLTETAGAFAAGVLLANTNYRAQIQADILPFKGILLGIFFMDAGSNFDFDLVVREWPTVLGGAAGLILVKALTLIVATRVPKQVEPNRLPTVDALRIGILLSGGGEFAFVVLAVAEKIDILPKDVIGLLTAIVLVTMGVTPVLGDIAESVSAPFIERSSREDIVDIEGIDDEFVMTASAADVEETKATIDNVAEDAIVVLGHSEVGRATVRVLSDLKLKQEQSSTNITITRNKLDVVGFSLNTDLIGSVLVPSSNAAVFYGDANPNLIRASGINEPTAVFVTYQDHNRALSATSRIRVSFPDTPIYVRAATRRESRDLFLAGATDVIIEADELARSVPQLMKGVWDGPLELDVEYDDQTEYRQAAAEAANLTLSVVDDLFEVYESLDLCAAGLIGRQDVIDMFSKTKMGFVASDDKIGQMEQWLKTTSAAHMDPIDRIEFCRLYARAPEFVKESFGNLRES